MITPRHAQTMARYNRWANQNLYGCADRLSDADRRLDRKAFWGSIHSTLNHILWGDQIWLYRFGAGPKPKGGNFVEALSQYETWEELKAARVAEDETIQQWADALTPEWLEGSQTWHSKGFGRDFTQPRGLLVTHFFNHQTHHRGQVHCMITQCGIKPGDIDLPFLDAA